VQWLGHGNFVNCDTGSNLVSSQNKFQSFIPRSLSAQLATLVISFHYSHRHAAVYYTEQSARPSRLSVLLTSQTLMMIDMQLMGDGVSCSGSSRFPRESMSTISDRAFYVMVNVTRMEQ